MNAIPAEVLEDLAAAEAFAEGADEYVEIAIRTLEQREEEMREAKDNLNAAQEQLERAHRAQGLAWSKLSSLRKAEGVVRRADGYALVRTP